VTTFDATNSNGNAARRGPSNRRWGPSGTTCRSRIRGFPSICAATGPSRLILGLDRQDIVPFGMEVSSRQVIVPLVEAVFDWDIVHRRMRESS
jgi:hypothetical protein